MTKIKITAIILVLPFFQAFSQKALLESSAVYFQPEKSTADITAANDTLGISDFFNGTPTQYYVPMGGCVAGNNYYNDKVKAQQYNASNTLVLEEVVLWFGTKVYNSGDTTSAVAVKIYWLDSLGTNATGQQNSLCPGTILDSQQLLLSDISTTGYVSVAFPNHPITPQNFAVGIDLTSIALGDSVGLMTTTDGNAGALELSWEQWNDNSWHTMLNAWPLDIDFAIWPVVDSSSAGINSPGFFQGIKLGQCQPNPAGAETSIQYELQHNANVTFEMYDVLGKKVFSLNEGEQNKGKHTIYVSTEKLASGTYYYSLKAGDNRITKKMVVAK